MTLRRGNERVGCVLKRAADREFPEDDPQRREQLNIVTFHLMGLSLSARAVGLADVSFVSRSR